MDIKELIERAEEADKMELVVLHNAFVQAFSAVRENGSEGNLRTYRTAKEVLDQLSEKLSAKYFPEDAETALVFHNRLEALKHLKGQGYKIGKSKFYKDAASGLIRFEPDGAISEKSLERYIKVSGIQKFSEIGQNKGEEKESIIYEKSSKEVEKLSEQIKELKFKNEILEGQYFKRSNFDMELAARASVLDAGMRQTVRSAADRLVRGVSGDSTRAHILCEMFDGILDRLMREYADTSRFHVIMMAGETSDAMEREGVEKEKRDGKTI